MLQQPVELGDRLDPRTVDAACLREFRLAFLFGFTGELFVFPEPRCFPRGLLDLPPDPMQTDCGYGLPDQ